MAKGRGIQLGDATVSIGGNLNGLIEAIAQAKQKTAAAIKELNAQAKVDISGTADLSGGVTPDRIHAKASKLMAQIARRQENEVIELRAAQQIRTGGGEIGPVRIERQAAKAQEDAAARAEQQRADVRRGGEQRSDLSRELAEAKTKGQEQHRASVLAEQQALFDQLQEKSTFRAPFGLGRYQIPAGVPQGMAEAIGGGAGPAVIGALAAAVKIAISSVGEFARALHETAIVQRRVAESYSFAGVRGKNDIYLAGAASATANIGFAESLLDLGVAHDPTGLGRATQDISGIRQWLRGKQMDIDEGTGAYRTMVQTRRQNRIESAMMAGRPMEALRRQQSIETAEFDANVDRMSKTQTPETVHEMKIARDAMEQNQRSMVILTAQQYRAQMGGIMGGTRVSQLEQQASRQRMVGDSSGGLSTEMAGAMASLIIKQRQEAAQFLPGSDQAKALSAKHEADQGLLMARQKEQARAFSSNQAFGSESPREFQAMMMANRLNLVENAESITGQRDAILPEILKILGNIYGRLEAR